MKLSTSRLSLSQVTTESDIELSDIVYLLDKDTTEHLPQEWLVDSLSGAFTWLSERLAESSVIAIREHGAQATIGLLFLYGYNLLNSNNQVRCGYVITQKKWGQGYATELMQGLVSSLKSEQKTSALIGGVSPENVGSVKVLTKSGFVFQETAGNTDFYIYRF